MNLARALSVASLVASLVATSAYADESDAEIKDLSPALSEFSAKVAEGPALDRFGVAVTGTGSMSLWGFPMAGPGLGVATRVRVLDWVAVEAHADALAESFIMVGVMSMQLGVPIVVEAPLVDGVRPHVGIGPFVTAAHVFGHESVDLGTYAGAEIVGGIGTPLNDFLEARFQLRGHLAFGPASRINVGGSGTAGLMLTF